MKEKASASGRDSQENSAVKKERKKRDSESSPAPRVDKGRGEQRT